MIRPHSRRTHPICCYPFPTMPQPAAPLFLDEIRCCWEDALSSSRAVSDRYRRICLALWVAAMAALAYASLSPRLAPPGQFNLDKLVHSAAYMGTTLVGLRAVRQLWSSGFIVGATAIFGICLELGQSFVPGREPSIGDVVANSAGVIVAVLLGLAAHGINDRL